jgi:hypothetical protein
MHSPNPERYQSNVMTPFDGRKTHLKGIAFHDDIPGLEVLEPFFQ